MEALVLTNECFDAAAGPERRTVVLLHGYGVQGSDLEWLGRALVAQHEEAARGLRVILPVAPHLLDASAPDGGRMWFPVDMMALQVALLQRNWQALAEYSPPGLDAATAELGALMEALAKEGTPDSEVVVAGFSQGALVAANWAFQTQRQVAGLVLFSAMMQRQSQWDALIPGRRGLPVLQVHSPQDPVVPYVLGKRLLDSMTRAGLQVTFLDAPPGHYIHVSMIEPLCRWLLAAERLDAKSVG